MYGFTSEQLCLQYLSESIWYRRGAAKWTRLSFGEETVTESLLLDLCLHFPGRVAIVPFTKAEEAKVGGDWAWAFFGPDGRSYQGMLVQAKRLDDEDRRYAELYYQRKSTQGTTPPSQLNALIQSGRRWRLPPVVAFYNHLDDPGRIPAGRCRTLDLIPRSQPAWWGVSIASAVEVLRAKPDKSFDRHRFHSQPLHCLLCSGGTGQRDDQGLAGAAARGLSMVFEGAGTADVLGPELSPPFRPTTDLPDVFRQAERARQEPIGDEDDVVAGFRREFPGIAGVVLIRDAGDRRR